MKIRIADNESNRRNYITKGIIGAELKVDELQGALIRCGSIYLFKGEYEVVEEGKVNA